MQPHDKMMGSATTAGEMAVELGSIWSGRYNSFSNLSKTLRSKSGEVLEEDMAGAAMDEWCGEHGEGLKSVSTGSTRSIRSSGTRACRGPARLDPGASAGGVQSKPRVHAMADRALTNPQQG